MRVLLGVFMRCAIRANENEASHDWGTDKGEQLLVTTIDQGGPGGRVYVEVFVNLKKKNTAESSNFVNQKSRVCSVF
jgi:hypothetical protein